MATRGAGGGGAFLTQKNEKITEVKKEIEELESLLGGTAQVVIKNFQTILFENA